MILVGNQRGGAKNLALHLLKEENEHVQVHELRGFASDNLMSALNESYAISKATRCRQFMFSLSLNPPPNEQVSTEDFEKTIERAETELGLTGQPRAIVFHEKQGRRHAHAVWSRINVEEMKAVQLSFTKRKLTELSRDLFIEHQWKMPRGLMNSQERDPRNFSLQEWQQAKRAEKDPREVKTAFQDCWAVSDSRGAFMQALDERGYKLARGDRRGFVAVDMKGEVYAVAKWVGIKTKDVRSRLGEPDNLPSVDDRRTEFAQSITDRLAELRSEEERKATDAKTRVEAQHKVLVERQRGERARQDAMLKKCWDNGTSGRQKRFNRGIRRLFDRLTGRAAHIRKQNIDEAYQALQRDRRQKDETIFRHLTERRALDDRLRETLRTVQDRKQELKADIQRYGPAQRGQDKSARPARDTGQNPNRDPPSLAVTPEFSKVSRASDGAHDQEVRRETFMRKRHTQQNNNRTRTGSRSPER